MGRIVDHKGEEMQAGKFVQALFDALVVTSRNQHLILMNLEKLMKFKGIDFIGPEEANAIMKEEHGNKDDS